MGRRLLVAIGCVGTAFGLLFVLQGLGMVRWPASSFMIDAKIWVIWGFTIVVIGLGMILWRRRQS